jgi:hypothetical protein
VYRQLLERLFYPHKPEFSENSKRKNFLRNIRVFANEKIVRDHPPHKSLITRLTTYPRLPPTYQKLLSCQPIDCEKASQGWYLGSTHDEIIISGAYTEAVYWSHKGKNA